MRPSAISFLKSNDLTILLSLYFLLLPIGKTLWYPLFVMAIIGGCILFQELKSGYLTSGTKWLLLGGSFVWVPAIFSLINSVDLGRTFQFVGTYPLFFSAGYFIYKRLSAGVSVIPAVYVISCIVVFWGALAIWQYVDPQNPFGPGGSHNQGIHTRDNPFVDGGLMMGVILGSLFSFLVFALWARGSNLVAIVFGLFIIGLVYISGTRSAWLSVLVTLAAVPVVAILRGFKPSIKTYLVSMLLLVTVAFAGAFAYQQPGLQVKLNQTLTVFKQPTAEGLDRTLSGRMTIWTDAVNLGIENPLVGTGVNNFRFAQPLVAPLNSRWVRDYSEQSNVHDLKGASHTHQMFLEAWSGAGFLGVLGLLLFFVWLTRTSIQVGKTGSLLAAGALVALWAGFFPLNTHNNFYGGWMSAWFWVWMGISAGLIFRNSGTRVG
ncbi:MULTISPECIES: O-antigen ligase [unclassified Marinobacterium]|uniref:O-antigen ligase family protein n=1 Tax=unclassified Marinobacterium TaxID=2644139 RepID=UPI0015699B80|nr:MULTISPECIES: O-antigen ligase family protein [unclassified Marinobacterium]NRP53014.1 O-Antigen ligase [Marinobacterium sp. xm-v-242]NRP77595.1 O-Antigen ligase [Marinobacterium sp. xm-m-383]